MNKGVVAIVAHDCIEAAKGEEDLEQRILKCMKAAVNHWLTSDINHQAAAALGAAMSLSNEEEQHRIMISIGEVKVISAILDGVPVDVEEVLKARTAKPIPLAKLWQEAIDV